MKEIAAEAFYHKWMDQKLTILDVREVDEFLDGHVKGSQNTPLSQLESLYPNLEKNKEYYILCHAGQRSLRASHFLQDKGFQVVNVKGGVTAFPGQLVKGEEE